MIKEFFAKKINKQIIKIYPLTLILSFLASILEIISIDNLKDNLLTNFIIALYLTIPLSAKMETIGKFNKLKHRILMILTLTNLLLLTLVINSSPSKEKIIFIFLLSLCYLSVYFLVPSKNFKDIKNNLEYFIETLSHFLSSFLSSLILYLGFVFIIYTLTELFNINFNNNIFEKTFIAIIGFFFIPTLLSSNEGINRKIYSKFLEFILLKVLFPLLIIYSLILYAYMLKITINKIYPKNIVPYLTLFYCVSGSFFYHTASLLENKWLKKFLDYFYMSIIPLVLMAYVSIIPRLLQYSFTEKRYLIFVVTVWLTILILSNLFFKKKEVYIFKISFLSILFLSSIGPVSAINFSKFSQKLRLNKLLALPKNSLNKNQNMELYEILNYFYSKHNISDTGITKESIQPKELMKKLGYHYEEKDDLNLREWYNFQGENKIYNISEYQFFIPDSNKPSKFGEFSIEKNKDNNIIIKEKEFIKNIPIDDIIKEFIKKNKEIEKNENSQIESEFVYTLKIPEIKKEFLFIFKELNFYLSKDGKAENVYSDFSVLIKIM